MLIRQATEQDIPAMVELLKRSLGETSSPKTLAYWQWKHIQNPFGVSPVLCAEEEGEIIAVRTMLQWRWQKGDMELKAFRAVDTATHPLFQGMGLFKKLTLQMVEDLRQSESDFIFNTPNKQSSPGYLKMGWREIGRVRVGIAPGIFFGAGKKKIIFPVAADEEIDSLCEKYNRALQKTGNIFTPKSSAYLNWRYEINPVVKYDVQKNAKVYMATTVRKRRFLKELRISELICDAHSAETKEIIHSHIADLCRKHHTQLVTFAPNVREIIDGLKVTAAMGPALFYLNLAKEKEIPALSSWSFSLGDLELF